jgi:hypothetical protein
MMLGVPLPAPTDEPALPPAEVPPHGVCRAPACGEPVPLPLVLDWPGVGAGEGPVPLVPVFGGMVTD